MKTQYAHKRISTTYPILIGGLLVKVLYENICTFLQNNLTSSLHGMKEELTSIMTYSQNVLLLMTTKMSLNNEAITKIGSKFHHLNNLVELKNKVDKTASKNQAELMSEISSSLKSMVKIASKQTEGFAGVIDAIKDLTSVLRNCKSEERCENAKKGFYKTFHYCFYI